MRILLFGATGPLGRSISETALRDGHEITEFVCMPGRLDQRHERLTVITGDVLDTASVTAVIPGHDAVVGAVGQSKQAPAGMFRHPALEPVIEAMKTHQVPRLVWVSAHGVGDSRGCSGLVFEHVLRPLLWRAEYADKEHQETAVRNSGLDWTIVRPARLTGGLATGRYRAAERIKLLWRSHISRADVADFVVGELHKQDHLRRCPTLTGP
ncbi:NAD(P)-dependent oxidoreductase [Actinomadura sp. HBU206391]|uniref:NAD(P)-dependent oxidoreductase n=1 Tax=Actinomadura sp. HBU206391 TaxID=2731692 RepID=UPI001650500E|nr:SDR family oxidoreductase [Actinomadura sp. HBU206391]MBC6459118.1 SDR family oxidoreductase [Actinomadura sp. HBU206391]